MEFIKDEWLMENTRMFKKRPWLKAGIISGCVCAGFTLAVFLGDYFLGKGTSGDRWPGDTFIFLEFVVGFPLDSGFCFLKKLEWFSNPITGSYADITYIGLCISVNGLLGAFVASFSYLFFKSTSEI